MKKRDLILPVWRAVNLTPEMLKKIVSIFESAEHYELYRVEYDKHSNDVSELIFEVYERVVVEDLLPKGFVIESGKEKFTNLALPLVEDHLIIDHEISDFIISIDSIKNLQKATGIIGAYLLMNDFGPLPIYSQKTGFPMKEIMIRLSRRRQVELLEELLSEGFNVCYQDFDWTLYGPER